ncbi:MAG: sialidase family protein [Planctomycetota bacterium]
MSRFLLLLISSFALASPGRAQEEPKGEPAKPLEIVRLVTISNEAPHSAFTDLVRWQGELWCAFREASSHVPGSGGSDGVIHVIHSDDGTDWQSEPRLAIEGLDLRDPKLSVMPDGRLMLLMGGSRYVDGKFVDRLCRVSFRRPAGDAFTEPVPIEVDAKIRTPEDWLWRVTWRGEVGYGVIYRAVSDGEWKCHLVATRDGIRYWPITEWDMAGGPTEATLRFLPDDRMAAILRRDGGDRRGWLGESDPPYRKWTWKELPIRLGGPDMVRLPSGDWLIGSRDYETKGNRTALYRVTSKGEVERLLELPSRGDTSYPGMVLEEGRLSMSYYASHEGKSAVYFAEIRGDLLEGK